MSHSWRARTPGAPLAAWGRPSLSPPLPPATRTHNHHNHCTPSCQGLRVWGPRGWVVGVPWERERTTHVPTPSVEPPKHLPSGLHCTGCSWTACGLPTGRPTQVRPTQVLWSCAVDTHGLQLETCSEDAQLEARMQDSFQQGRHSHWTWNTICPTPFPFVLQLCLCRPTRTSTCEWRAAAST